MSFHYPRRVKDLPTLELESEDELNTPIRGCNTRSIDKENKIAGESSSATASNTPTSTALTNLRIPKRSSELPALESDSEEDDNGRGDNLNCAILNDSFILSPSNTPLKAHNGEVENLSFLSNFHKMALSSKPSREVRVSPPPVLARVHNGIIQRSQVKERGSCSQKTKPLPVDSRSEETPLKTANADGAKMVSTTKNVDPHFVTPQIRSFSITRRPRDLCTTQSQKKSSMVNEFRSQKVLFQTPMALPRVPVACLSNDSISLSLCDTINESSNTPNSIEKCTKVEQDKQSDAIKSRKSLQDTFGEAETAPNTERKLKSNLAPKSIASVADALNTPVANITENAPSIDNVLRINNVEYAIVKKLGCGGSSSVYFGKRKDNAKDCAVKIVDLRGDPAIIEGYLNETKLLAKLQGNICVVALFDYQLNQQDSQLYMIMEKGDTDLSKILQTYTTKLPLYLLVNFLYQMLQAVNYIHQNGVIHSDLKPANFLMVNGRLKLIDFGIASNIAVDSTSIIKFSQAGTFNYISPEALTDTSTGTSPMRGTQPKIKISTKSDVWSLGCILYLLLFQKTPFGHIKNIYAKISAISNPRHTIEYPPLSPFYPLMLIHMAKKCLQHNAKERPSCAELLQYPFDMIIPLQSLIVPPKKS